MFQLLHILGLKMHRHTRTFCYGVFLSIGIFAVGLVPAYATTGWWNVGWLAATVPLVSDSYYTNQWTVFSSTGQAYMIYRDVNNGSGATVATLSGETWTTVGDPAFSAGAVVDPRIAISDDGVLYAAYRDEANGGALVIQTFDGTSWVDMGSATFSQTSNIGFWLNLVVDPNGIPYVAFTHSGYLGIYKYVSGAWEPVGATGSISAMSFMAQGVNEQVLTFAPDGTPYLAYMIGGSGFWVKQFDGTSWVGVWSSDGLVETYMDYMALAVVDNNEIYVAYMNKMESPRVYGTVKKWDGAGWSEIASNIADGVGKGISAPQLAIGADQTVYLKWYDYLVSKETVYSINESSLVLMDSSLPNAIGWGQPGQLLVNPVTGTLYSVGEYTTINVRGVGIFEYSDLPTTDSYLGTAINGSGTGILAARSLVFDSTGTGYVAYVDYVNGRNTTVMKYASGSWSTVGAAGTIPTATGSSYNLATLSIAPDDTPYVSFRDGSNTTVGGKASVMKWDGSAWVYVGSAGFSSGQANPLPLVFSPSGTPYVAYRDLTSGYTAVRYFDGTTWQNVWPTETIVSYISSSSYPAFAPNGDLYVAMNDVTTNARGTNVLKWDGTAWNQVGAAHIGAYAGSNYSNVSGMAVGTDGTPYTLTADMSTSTIHPRMYLWKFDGTDWIRVGSPLGRFIPNARLQISRTGNIYVAYVDTVNRGSSGTPTTFPITIKRLVDDEWVTVGEENFNTSTISAVWPDINPINNLPYVAIVDANSKISVISPLLVLTGSTAVSATLSAGVVSVATPTTIAFPSASVSNAAQILTVSGGTFTVQDLKGANAWYYATISMGNLSSGGNTITAANIAANVSEWVSTVAGNSNANVTVPSSAGTLGAGYVALNSANTLVQRSTGGSILGKYSIPLNLRITIPAYTPPGSYAGIMTVTLIEN